MLALSAPAGIMYSRLLYLKHFTIIFCKCYYFTISLLYFSYSVYRFVINEDMIMLLRVTLEVLINYVYTIDRKD